MVGWCFRRFEYQPRSCIPGLWVRPNLDSNETEEADDEVVIPAEGFSFFSMDQAIKSLTKSELRRSGVDANMMEKMVLIRRWTHVDCQPWCSFKAIQIWPLRREGDCSSEIETGCAVAGTRRRRWWLRGGRPMKAGDKISLAEVRACIEKNEKTPSKTSRKESPVDRGNHNSQGIPRRRNSPRPSDRVNRSGPPSKNTDTRDRRNGGKRNDADRDTRIRENANGRINPKRRRDDERTIPPDTREGRHLFLEGVNHKNNAGSFWDLKDPEIGWRIGANLIGDHDRLHLLPQPIEVLTRSLASSAFQILSLAQTFQFREERSQNSDKRLDEEVTSLRGECKRLGEEATKARDDFLKSQKELEEKSKKYDAMCKDMELLRGKYSHESETGETFLNSSIGKNLLRSTGEKAIEGYQASTAFRDEVIQRAIVIHDEVVVDCRKELRDTQLVPEEIIMMIHPKIPEPRTARVEDDSDPPLGNLLGGLGDEEMIEALRSNF
ncbi:uncharacterized protein [Henckelia pumila]|uniref:uncharacterized protein n=1 Tax=Henckelia pumila TaxID=405737 RepID=UPI003C6DDF26